MFTSHLVVGWSWYPTYSNPTLHDVSTSAAAGAGVTTNDILSAWDWSSESVIQKFYYKLTSYPGPSHVWNFGFLKVANHWNQVTHKDVRFFMYMYLLVCLSVCLYLHVYLCDCLWLSVCLPVCLSVSITGSVIHIGWFIIETIADRYTKLCNWCLSVVYEHWHTSILLLSLLCHLWNVQDTMTTKRKGKGEHLLTLTWEIFTMHIQSISKELHIKLILGPSIKVLNKSPPLQGQHVVSQLPFQVP